MRFAKRYVRDLSIKAISTGSASATRRLNDTCFARGFEEPHFAPKFDLAMLKGFDLGFSHPKGPAPFGYPYRWTLEMSGRTVPPCRNLLKPSLRRGSETAGKHVLFGLIAANSFGL